MAWLVVEFPVPEMVSEAAAEALRAAGADGVAEEWRAGQTFVRGFWRDARESEVTQATDSALRRLLAVGLLDSVPSFTITTLEDQDWLEGWKQYFSPLVISPRLAIVPGWEQYTPLPGQAVVVLDPGMAFGTGGHGTTFACLQALADFLQPGMSVCDIGTGSGILAIAAAKLGGGHLVATDTDPLSIRVARENAGRNDVTAAIDFRVADLLEGVDGPFELLLANILAPVILTLAPQLARVLAPHGIVITSGYLLSQEAEIRDALQSAGQQLLARYEREGWVTLVTRVEG